MPAEGPVLVTGSQGLIGTALTALLRRQGTATIGVDLRHDHPESAFDVRDGARLAAAMAEAAGVVHLAAVSRVIDGEREPERCRAVNIGGTRIVLQTAAAARRRPWVIVASSREVYGEQEQLPVAETAELRPKNVYAEAKAAGETLATEAAAAGLRVAIVRFSNVFGSIADHPDRVVPAFAAAAAAGATLRIDGGDNTFDFTYVDDVVDGVARLAAALEAGERPPPIHFVSGRPVTLMQLAQAAIALGRPGARLVEAPSRTFDVARFWGDPSRALAVLGWRATTPLDDGLRRMVERYTQAAG